MLFNPLHSPIDRPETIPVAWVRLHGGQPPNKGAHEGQLPLEGHGGEGRDMQEEGGLWVGTRGW